MDALPISTRNGIEELDSRFLKMKHGLLSNDQFVDQIHGAIKTFFGSLDDAHCQGEVNSQLLAQLPYIEDGIQFIKGAMNNRLLASRYLYESNLFSPHNMGPFSALYLFYEEFIDLFERLVISYNNTKNEPWAFTNVNFLMDISAYSSVRAQVFVPNACTKPPANMLIGITINEHSFFQVKATMILLLHEIGHFVRPFKRRKRNQVLVAAVVNWLCNMVYGQLNDYIHAELLHANDQSQLEEKTKIDIVREHFEQEVFPIIGPVISVVLNECFEEFVKSEQVTSVYGNQDQFANFLTQFHEILDSFLVELSNELSEMLLLPIREARVSEDEETNQEQNVPRLGIKAKILKHLKNEVEIENENGQGNSIGSTVYFNYLCEAAMRLFDAGNLFEYNPDIGNSVPGAAIDSYLNSLSLMGLTEVNSDNIEHFAAVAIHFVKRAVETMREEAVLDMLIRSLEETLANMFWIRTLDIRDFDTYWEIFEPLIRQAAYSEREQIQYFGIPNAIVTEYFDLYSTGNVQEFRKYNLSPIDATTPLPRINNIDHPLSSQDKWIEELRYIFFVPIAQYLLEENDVFPEHELFHIKENSSLSDDGKLVQDLREKFKQFSYNTSAGRKLSDELEMIEFFKHTR